MRAALLALGLLLLLPNVAAADRYQRTIDLRLGVGRPSLDTGPEISVRFHDVRPRLQGQSDEELVGEAPRRIYAKWGAGGRVARQAVEIALLREGFRPVPHVIEEGPLPTLNVELLVLFSRAGGFLVLRHHEVTVSVRLSLRLPGKEQSAWSATVTQKAGVAIGGAQKLYAIADAYTKALRQLMDGAAVEFASDSFRKPLCALASYLECAPEPAPVSMGAPFGAPPPASAPGAPRSPTGYSFSATITGLRSAQIETSSGHRLQIKPSHAAVSYQWSLGAKVTLEGSILENHDTGESVVVIGVIFL